MKINENGFRGNKSEICCFDQKENDKKYILKNDERIVIHYSHES